MKLIILLSVFALLFGFTEAQTATFYTKTKSEVFTSDTAACAGCQSGITEVLISADSTFDCTKYTAVAFQAYGNASECAMIQFTGGGTQLGKVPICVGTGINIVNNGKVLGTAEVSLGNLSTYITDNSDTLAPSVICIAIK